METPALLSVFDVLFVDKSFPQQKLCYSFSDKLFLARLKKKKK
jgi:hypothetical protein